MFHSIEEFLSIWHQESESTLKLFQLLTDASLSQKVSEEGRSLGRLANHLIESLTEMPHKLGLPIEEEQPALETTAELVAAYQRVNAQFIDALESNWNDDDLERETNMYGEQWKNGHTLFVIVVHQSHHRGQMTVLMRQAGLKVIGVYGPSKEEWEEMNIPAMA
ncbi:MAG TPA: DinB family protein [Flavipsychrobacter sp.]|nr:DinB family protein [Flavipsychrobacter sp.]